MIGAIDHIGIAVKNLDEAIVLYRDVLGFHFEGVQTLNDRKIKIASFRCSSESHIELVQPLSSDSTVAKFLENRGEGIHHFAVKVNNIKAVLDEYKLKPGRVREMPLHRAGVGHRLRLAVLRRQRCAQTLGLRPHRPIARREIGGARHAGAFITKGPDEKHGGRKMQDEEQRFHHGGTETNVGPSVSVPPCLRGEIFFIPADRRPPPADSRRDRLRSRRSGSPGRCRWRSAGAVPLGTSERRVGSGSSTISASMTGKQFGMQGSGVRETVKRSGVPSASVTAL